MSRDDIVVLDFWEFICQWPYCKNTLKQLLLLKGVSLHTLDVTSWNVTRSRENKENKNLTTCLFRLFWLVKLLFIVIKNELTISWSKKIETCELFEFFIIVYPTSWDVSWSHNKECQDFYQSLDYCLKYP